MLPAEKQLDKLVGLAMLVAATVVFLYYTVWTLLMVRSHDLFFCQELRRAGFVSSRMRITDYSKTWMVG